MPAEVTFLNLSSPIDNNYDIHWDFGDSTTADAISPTHLYNDTGTFDVRLEITSPIGCYTDTVFSSLVTTVAPPVANFSYEPHDASNFKPEVNFTDASIDAVHWDWYVNGILVAQKPDFSFVFADTGLQEVKLVVTHPEYCQDSITQLVEVTPKVTFFMPNAFTPNQDTNNDFFMGAGYTRGISNYRMEIWDRWGAKIFVSDDVHTGWNGRVNNTGRFAQNGIYVCLVTFTGPRGEPFDYKGYATLLR